MASRKSCWACLPHFAENSPVRLGMIPDEFPDPNDRLPTSITCPVGRGTTGQQTLGLGDDAKKGGFGGHAGLGS